MSFFVPDVPFVDFEAQKAVRSKIERLGLNGRLGVLEPLIHRLAAITGQTTLTFPRKTAVVLAADHGHALGDAQGTAAAVAQLARGGGPVSALARQAGVVVSLYDLGLARELKAAGLQNFSAGYGTKDMAVEPALALSQVRDALTIGMNIASIEIGQGLDVLALGELGFGGEVAAVASLQILAERPLDALTDDSQVAAIARQALARHHPEKHDPLDILRTVGGLELAGLAGVILAAAAGRIPLLLDGVVSSTAALIASHLNPAVRPYLIAAHRTGEKAHDVALRKLALRPLLDLGLTAPAGCGALLAFHLVEAAARALNETEESGIHA